MLGRIQKGAGPRVLILLLRQAAILLATNLLAI